MPMPSWPAERVAKLRALRKERLSFAECAAALDVSVGAVAGKWARLNGYKRFPARSPRPQRAPNGSSTEAVALVADGMSVSAAATETDLPYSTVYWAVLRSKERERKELLRISERDSVFTAWDHEWAQRDVDP